jgi:ferredoxin--NADP+ reductase
MKLEDLDRSRQLEATVVFSYRITPPEADAEVRELTLAIDGDLAFAPGQSIGVLVPGPHPQGHDVHFRLYTLAGVDAREAGGATPVTIAVRRVSYIDDYSGERFEGIASNYLCDLRAGDRLEVTGPYGQAFEIPAEPDADLILIGAGTGIAPFRAFVRRLYEAAPARTGKVRLFYGAHTGLEHIYMNEERDDFALYYDRDTFEAFKAVSPRPNWADPIAWDYCLELRSEEILEMLDRPETRVYLAGLEEIRDQLDEVFARLVGSREKWQRRRAELVAGGRWHELLY